MRRGKQAQKKYAKSPKRLLISDAALNREPAIYRVFQGIHRASNLFIFYLRQIQLKYKIMYHHA